MFGSPASPFQGDLIDVFGIKSSFWPPPWSLFVLVAIGLGYASCWYCKKYCINIIYVLSLFTTSHNYNNQEKLKTNKKNNKKNVSISMSEGYGPVSILLSTKKSRQSFVMVGSITALVAAFHFKAHHAVVEVGNTPPSSLPLGLPPPIDFFGEVAVEEVSSEYEEVDPHTPMARASFLKDNAASLLRGATVQTFLLSPDSKEGEEGLDDIIVEKPEGVSIFGSDDLLSLSKSGFHLVGLKGYDQMPFKFSGRVCTLFQSLGQLDGGPSSSAFFSMASLGSKAVGFLSGATPVQDIFEKSDEGATTVSESASDEFATQTEDYIIGFVSNMDVGELKPDTSINYDSCTCPTDMHLRYKHFVKDGYGQCLGGLTKWINRVLLASSNDNRDGSCMKVSEASGDWPYSTDESINSYQNGLVYCLLKKASNPTTLGGLDVDSATKKASLLKVFSDKCIGSDEVSFLKNKATSFIKDRTTSLLSGATVTSYLGVQQQRGEDLDDDSLHIQLPIATSGMPFDSDPPSVCVTVHPNGISKEVGVEVSNDLGHSGLNMSKASISSTIGLDERVKVQQRKPSLSWYLVLTMMVTLILGAFFKLNEMPKFMFDLQRARVMLVSRRSPRYSLRKNKKARQMSFTRLVQLVMLSITLSNVLMPGISVYALDIGENSSGDNLEEMSSDVLGGEYEKVETDDQLGQNLIDDVASGVHDAPEFEDQFLLNGLYDDLKDDEYETMIALMKDYEQEELGDRISDKAHLWPTKSDIKSSDMALIEKGQSSSEMKELEEFRRQQLRGSIEGDVNHLAIIPRIVDFLQHRVDEAKALKNIILNGNVAEAAAALTMYFDNTQAVAKIASSADEEEEHALDFSLATNDGEGRLHGRKLRAFLSEVAPDELVDILHLNDDGIDEMEHYANVMEDVERKLFPGSSRSRRNTQKMSSVQGTLPNFSMNNKFEKPKLPKLKVVEQLKAKRGIHGQRRLEEVAPQCREKCQSDDYQCNCQLLVDYARNLSWYDTSVMFLGGFVQGDPDVDDYGDLNVDYMSEIDMFGLRNQFPEKMQSIEDKADEVDKNMSETSCIALLSELHTACGEDTCTEPNMDSFQLSVNQVGSSVNTHTKLKVEVIGEFYDFQQSTVRRDNFGNNQVTNTPLNERRPVRCCRDDEPTDDEEIWYKSPVSISVTEPVRKVRIEIPFNRNLHMREVEVIDMNDDNVAYRKPAQQSNILNNNAAENAVDGNLNNLMQTGTVDNPWWEVDLGTSTQIRAVRIFNRNSGADFEIGRLSGAIVTLYGDNDQEVARVQFGSVNWHQYTIVNRIAGCPYAWEQKWTGDVAVPALPVLSAVQVSSLAIGSANVGISDYSPLTDTWTLDGPSNGHISGIRDIFQYTYVLTTGDIDMRLRVTDYTGTTSSHCAGLMIRQSLDADSRHFSILYCGDKRVRRLRRNDVGGDTLGVPGNTPRETDVIEGEVWLRITFGSTHNDNNFRVWTSSDGTDGSWVDLGWGGGFPNSGFTRNSNFFVGVAVSNWILEASDFTIDGVPALPDDLALPSTPPAVDGYTSYHQRMCNIDNQFLDVGIEDEDGFIRISSAQACATYCDDRLDCVSFDFLANEYCRLSSSCEHFSLTDPDVRSIWYFKNIAPPSYKKYGESLCTTSASDLASTNANSVQECANQCSENHECVSIAYQKTGSTECRLSSTCYEYNDMSDDSGWDTYVKRDGEDDEDEDICPFLPFAQAKEYCEEAGGRLCTRSELEDGCASFMGCNFDTANVWSSTETDPMTCPATYQQTCGDFITAFESLYNAVPPVYIRKVRIELTSSDFLHLREVEVFDMNGVNIAEGKPATQSSTQTINEAGKAVDGDFITASWTTWSSKPWWEVDLGTNTRIKEIRIANQADNSNQTPRLSNSIVTLKDENGQEVARYQFGSVDWADYTLTMDSFTLVKSSMNPMRVNENDPVNPIDLSNTQFPTAYNWIIDPTSGIRTINPDNTYKYSALSNKTEDLFCGVSQGPPSELARACDDSMEFLLGPSVSIGFLTSTANDVNEFDPDEPIPEPRWITWYTNQNDTNSIAFFDKWTGGYLKIEDSGGDPIWMEDYLSIQDENPFILSQSQTFYDTEIRSMNEIYCVDKSISGDDQTLQFCQRSWLDDKTNRYSDMTWYKSIQYPSSDMAPYNETCEFSTCQESWLENDLNPFSEEDNAGCYAFYDYCRGYDPSRYQCNVFWDYCRAEQDSRNPGWKYPKENCKDTDISLTEDIVTCPIEWLNNTMNPYIDELEQNESCYNFWNYCRNELDEINSDWVYPRPTCNDDNGDEIETCQIAWLDDETNPYDSTTDSECYEFWDFCRLGLLTKYERYVWPLPAEPTVDDLLPGYCCLDTPTEDRTTKFWGDHYTAARSEAGMKCANRGFWYMGMSAEACHNGGGQFFQTACVTLQHCIDARPRKGEDGYKETFEEWVYENGVEIYDPSDQEQCEQTRVALDFDADYYNDYEVCETFEALLCDEFFEDLQFLDDIANEGPVQFEQVTFKEIVYPEDKPLFFQELPKEIPFMKTDDAKDITDDWDDVVDSLEVSKRSLGFLKGNAMDGIKKYIDYKDATLKAAAIKCDTAKKVYEVSMKAKEYGLNVCNKLQKVILGKSNPLYNICLGGYYAKITATYAKQVAWRTCEITNKVADFLTKKQQLVLWWIHYGIKVAHEGVDTALFAHKLKESKIVEEYDFVEATYNNLISQFEWTHDALGVMTNNNIKQHTQMREELQKRHQDITNDVNQYTNCMSNFLGIQIFNALPGTRTGPLSSTCQNILGVSGRRLEEGGPFSLDVEFTSESFVGKQETIIENEEKIMVKEDEIMNMQVDMNSIVSALRDRMATLQDTVNAIAMKLDMDPGQPRENDSKSKKSKKAKQEKPKIPDSSDESDLFTRNLLAVEEVKDKFDDMKSQVKSMEGKVESMEDKVESVEVKVDSVQSQGNSIEGQVKSIESKVGSMEGKIESIEKTMEELKDMLSQLMMRGADIA